MHTIIQLGFKSLTCTHSSKSHYDHTYIHTYKEMQVFFFFLLRQCRFGGDLLWVAAAETKKKRSESKRSHGVFVIFALAFETRNSKCERERELKQRWVSNTSASIACLEKPVIWIFFNPWNATNRVSAPTRVANK